MILFSRNISPLILSPKLATKHNTSAFIGIKIFAVKKSRKSKIDFLKIKISAKSPKDSVAKIEIIATITKITKQAFALEYFILSIKDATGTSKMLMPEVKAAKKSNKKNNAKMTFPKEI